MNSERKVVGRVRHVYRYPVKGMAGEQLEEVRLGWQGFDEDRAYAFYELCSKSGLPWLSPRRYPKLITYAANVGEEGEAPLVATPAGTVYPFWSDELREMLMAATRRQLAPIRLFRRAYDAQPISLITTQSVQMISDEVGYELEFARFRPNLVVDADAARSFPEEKWVGASLGFGDERDAPRVRIARRDPRCAVINYHPQTGEGDASVLRKVVQLRRNQLGVYGTVERPGLIRVGDPVWIKK